MATPLRSIAALSRPTPQAESGDTHAIVSRPTPQAESGDTRAIVVGLQRIDSDAFELLAAIDSELNLIIPRLVAQEVTRNLTTSEQVRQFYRLFQDYNFAQIIDEPVPPALVEKYTMLGLPAKADAFIGAFAEWMEVSYLISENRHFLRQLQAPAFRVLNASDFVIFWKTKSQTNS